MSITVKRYTGETITPKDDRILFDSIFENYGLLFGGSATMSAFNSINVGAARGFVKGTEVIIESEDVEVLLSESGEVPGRLKIVIDYSDTNEPVKFVSEVGNNLAELRQDEDVNYTDGVFEVEYATYTASETTISNVVFTMPTLKTVKEKLSELNNALINNMASLDWDNTEEVTLSSTLGSSWTAPKNGVLHLDASTATEAIGLLYIRSSKFGTFHRIRLCAIGAIGAPMAGEFIVNEGETLTVSYVSNSTLNNQIFIPFK